ncbi:PIN domain protein [Verrucomicrobia bacterium]|nr:PIN domain protein [Verrucomicrobiota bacterium]
MRIYLDNCSLNRPFDSQKQLRIRLETEAKLAIQEKISQGEFELAWSYVIDFENTANPYQERREVVWLWKSKACIDVDESDQILDLAERVSSLGLKNKDSLHIGCAIFSKCDFFVTTDDGILRLSNDIQQIQIRNPIDFVREIFNED